MGIRAILGAASGGGEASWEYVAEYLKRNYIENPREKERRAQARKRDAFYEGKGDEYISDMIDKAFSDPLTKKLRKDLVSFAKWNNVIGRVVREKATVYSEVAKRSISRNNKVYQDFLNILKMDQVMRELNRKLVLHEDAWVQYRVRITPRGPQPVLDVISPAKFWAVCSPSDPTMLIAIIIDQSPSYHGADTLAPHYRVWTDNETFLLDGACRIIGKPEEWPLGIMPGVLATTRPPEVKGQLLADTPSADLVAAHESAWFEALLLLKESKSTNNQTYVSGDVSNATMNQSADTETEVTVPEGVSIQSVSRGVDLSQFRENINTIIEQAGANHGLPPSVLHHRDASSGAEIALRRIPLRELRKEQILVMRAVERDLAKIQSLINGQDLQEYAFSVDGWSIDFGEIQQPLTEQERDQVFENRRRLLLTDTIEEEMRRNPDLRTPEEAAEVIAERVRREVTRVQMAQDLARINGSASSEVGDPTAEQNGARGQEGE